MAGTEVNGWRRVAGMFLGAVLLVGAAAMTRAEPDPASPQREQADSAKASPPKATSQKTAKGKGASTDESRSGKKEADKPKRTAKDDDPAPRHEPSYAEILKALQKETRRVPRPVTPPSDPSGHRRAVPVLPRDENPVRAPARTLLPDGSRLVDRSGRLTREGDYFTFSFEDRGQGAPELPIRLLPNRLLEDMEIVSAGGTKPIVFVVSGEVTEYRGVNYLLIQKLLVRPDLGNLK